MEVRVTESDKNIPHNNEISVCKGSVCSVVVSLEFNPAGVPQITWSIQITSVMKFHPGD